MTQHTPGPWQSRKASVESSKPRVQIAHCGANFTAGIDGTRSISGEGAEANARLIAAAPEMLEVLAEYLVLGAGKCTIGRKQADRALAVIRKATEQQK